ncbi:MAG: His/Gly/Thr/Pro-type tRNA ligase C-terminal domain-containing protein, partial [Pseudomonadota bacterium]|nr:His/Gly/Thr/Pro-type tRNA ligase C-terminal domain-containing protein [Pseudomonadota bacterium]
LVGGIIEASHDDKGIIWPRAVAPFDVAVVNLKPDDDGCTACAEDLYARLGATGGDPLMDDRDERPGAKLASIDLIGIPWQIVIGPRGMANGVVEVKNRSTGEAVEVSPESALRMVIDGAA